MSYRAIYEILSSFFIIMHFLSIIRMYKNIMSKIICASPQFCSAREDLRSIFILGSLWKHGAMHMKISGVRLSRIVFDSVVQCMWIRRVHWSRIVFESMVQCIWRPQEYINLGYRLWKRCAMHVHLGSMFILDSLWKHGAMHIWRSKAYVV